MIFIFLFVGASPLPLLETGTTTIVFGVPCVPVSTVTVVGVLEKDVAALLLWFKAVRLLDVRAPDAAGRMAIVLLLILLITDWF